MIKTARQTAFEILLKTEKDKAYSNLALDSAVRGGSLNSTDCAFITRLVYGVTERKLTLDHIYKKYLNSSSRLKPEVMTVLRMGAYQIIYMDKIPNEAAVNESVVLAKKNCSYAAGLVNGVLRKVAAGKNELGPFGDETERISVTYSAPKELVSLITYHYGTENAEAFFRSSLEPKRITVRVNTVRTDENGLIAAFEKEGITAEKSFLKNALYVSFNGAIYETEAYKNGLFHVEDISSQLCVAALSPYEGCTMLDVCAAPGGKTFAACEYMNNKGTLISCDIHPHRVKLIEESAQRLGLDIKATVNDALEFNGDFPECDRVLCDVPCSGLGIITKKPEIKYKSLDDIKELIPIQEKILDVSSRYVRKGGRLVYSTCSVNPNENRKVCQRFLRSHPEFRSLRVLPETERCADEGDFLTLMPHINNCDGFFIALFERE